MCVCATTARLPLLLTNTKGTIVHDGRAVMSLRLPLPPHRLLARQDARIAHTGLSMATRMSQIPAKMEGLTRHVTTAWVELTAVGIRHPITMACAEHPQ